MEMVTITSSIDSSATSKAVNPVEQIISSTKTCTTVFQLQFNKFYNSLINKNYRKRIEGIVNKSKIDNSMKEAVGKANKPESVYAINNCIHFYLTCSQLRQISTLKECNVNKLKIFFSNKNEDQHSCHLFQYTPRVKTT